MAYNLQSIITILEQILNPEETRWIVSDDNKPQLQSLLQKAASLQHILEKSPGARIESLESRIRDAAQKAEDVVEGHMVDQLLSRSPEGVFFTFSTPDLQQVMEEFDSAMEQAKEILLQENTKKMSAGSSSSAGASFLPADPPISKKGVVVGVDEDLLQLKHRLTGHERKLEIIPIVGMGGIGKTTIARKLYEDPLILSHFDVCAWTTISKDIDVQAVLLDLLCRPGEHLSNELSERTNSELKDILYKRLQGSRYFVVLDDMWTTNSWDVIRSFFPHNDNGSRMVLTTRESELAENVGTQSCQHNMQLLAESDSWKLLCQIVFGGEGCPDIALEGIGRKIAGDCGGLPLAINVVGGLLSKAERSRDIWESIGKDISVAKANDDGLSNVLSLSYNHLPNHLKPCFLYFGAFPEDYDVKGSTLTYMWMAEGFVKSNGDKISLEGEAEDYLRSLAERNLVVVTRKKSNGKAMEYGMHHLLRDLCRRKASDEKFVDAKNERVELSLHKHMLGRLNVHTTSYGMPMEEDMDVMSLARSYICAALNMPPEIVSPVFLVLRLVRVLDLLGIQFKKFPREFLQLVNLRYLAFSCNSDIPGEISRLLNLQSLIGEIKGNDVPSEIWEMSELRHLKLRSIFTIEEGYVKQNIQEKLQTISWLDCNSSLIRMGFFKTIPNIKKLGIFLEELPSSSEEEVDLSHLHKLQTLSCQSNLNTDGCRFLPTIRFPCNLRKLTLIE